MLAGMCPRLVLCWNIFGLFFLAVTFWMWPKLALSSTNTRESWRWTPGFSFFVSKFNNEGQTDEGIDVEAGKEDGGGAPVS